VKPVALAVQAENRIASVALGGLMVLPLAQIAARKFFQAAIPGEAAIVSTLTLWLGMLGAAIAAREGKLLTLATGEFLPKGRIGAIARVFSGAVGAMIATVLAAGAVALVQSDRLAGDMLTEQIPVWVGDLALPIGFGLIAVRLAWQASPSWTGRGLAALGIVAGLLVNYYRDGFAGHALSPWLILVLAAGVLGAPIFSLLAGIALFASLTLGNPPVVLPMMAYQELTTSTGIAAIPLFTVSGFLLAEGKSSERLLRVFRAWVGWMPGGTAIAAAAL
jgi:TRAP-type C4-dicarboxylate transport system permease small subunit